jgi:outer membrane lipase/esterase
MRQTNFLLALFMAALLTACGGHDSNGGDQTPRTRFSAQVVFGDSLSDVGTGAVGAIAAAGGGKFTINGNNTALNPELTGKIWVELIAAQLGLPAPCAAQTGLDGDPALGFSVPLVNHPGCYGYAQGGARVTNPVGPGNKLTGSPLGQLTVPVVTQVANHLAIAGGRFRGDEVVFVTAGGNDAIALLGQLAAGATAAGQAAGAARFASTLTARRCRPKRPAPATPTRASCRQRSPRRPCSLAMPPSPTRPCMARWWPPPRLTPPPRARRLAPGSPPTMHLPRWPRWPLPAPSLSPSSRTS